MVQSSISAIKFNSFTVKVHVIFYRCIFATRILSVAIDKMCPLFVIQRSACGLNKEITAQQQTNKKYTPRIWHQRQHKINLRVAHVSACMLLCAFRWWKVQTCIKITYAAKLYKVFVLFDAFNIHYFRSGKGNCIHSRCTHLLRIQRNAYIFVQCTYVNISRDALYIPCVYFEYGFNIVIIAHRSFWQFYTSTKCFCVCSFSLFLDHTSICSCAQTTAASTVAIHCIALCSSAHALF